MGRQAKETGGKGTFLVEEFIGAMEQSFDRIQPIFKKFERLNACVLAKTERKAQELELNNQD